MGNNGTQQQNNEAKTTKKIWWAPVWQQTVGMGMGPTQGGGKHGDLLLFLKPSGSVGSHGSGLHEGSLPEYATCLEATCPCSSHPTPAGIIPVPLVDGRQTRGHSMTCNTRSHRACGRRRVPEGKPTTTPTKKKKITRRLVPCLATAPEATRPGHWPGNPCVERTLMSVRKQPVLLARTRAPWATRTPACNPSSFAPKRFASFLRATFPS